MSYAERLPTGAESRSQATDHHIRPRHPRTAMREAAGLVVAEAFRLCPGGAVELEVYARRVVEHLGDECDAWLSWVVTAPTLGELRKEVSEVTQ